METQMCMVLVLVLLIMLASGMIGYRLGFNRCSVYVTERLKYMGGEK